MRAHLSGNISLEQLASVCDLAVSYFARGFKNGTGVSPHRWLVEMRLEKAKDLLLNTKMPLAKLPLPAASPTNAISPGNFVARRHTRRQPGGAGNELLDGPLSEVE